MTPSTMYAFLFTDIAESTRLWEIHPEAMGPALGLPFIEEAMSASGPDSPDYASATTVKGELLLAAGDAVGAEKCFSLAVATAAGADVAMLDLVAATRLVRVRRDLGMVPDGTEELVRAHASFEEGFDLPQLREAAELLDGR